MGLLGDLTAYIDNLKRRGSNTLADLATNPLGLLSRNLSAFSESLPAAPDSVMPSGGGLLNRPGFQQWGMDVALNAPTMGLLGHTVYHGSPHKFDRFDASKIGTGEGAQAYGHGIYVAESPGVAEQYRKALSKYGTTINGAPLTPQHPQFDAGMQIAARGYDKALSDAKAALDSGFINPAYGKKQIEAIEALKGANIKQHQSGHVYKADLPDEWLPKMLDWDKPLSEQPEAVRRALAADRRAKDSLYGSGAEYYRGVGSRSAQNAPPHVSADRADELAQRDATEYLKSLGIPGIRYLDGGSRKSGEGTYNYVVFPGMEGLLKIISRE